MSFKNLLRTSVAYAASPIPTAVVVNSFGRAGSTLLFQSMIDSGAEASLLPSGLMRRAIWGEAWDLEAASLTSGRCYKTHDYPPSRAMRGKTLYVFGDPLATVLSLVERTSRDGQVWLNSHAQHLKAPETTPSDLLQNDSLGLFAHLKAWVEDKNHPALFVRYEELWSVVDQVADYIGMAIELPARKRRTVDRLEAPRETKLAYGEFSEYVASLPDYFVTGEAPPRVTQL